MVEYQENNKDKNKYFETNRSSSLQIIYLNSYFPRFFVQKSELILLKFLLSVKLSLPIWGKNEGWQYVKRILEFT
jgi:hypothetical protein